ncbi:hypothetical protein BH20ACT2_BH20ACT2_06030 [soil metagenome]
MLVVVLLVAYLPLTLLGYGTDLDVANVRRAGAAVLDGGYEPSRLPGAPVFEAAVGVLDASGGSVAVNLATVAVSVALVLALRRLLVRAGSPRPELACLVFALNPFTWIAATSTADFLWALGLLVVGAERHLAGRSRVAVVCFAAAIGCRASTALLVLGFLVAAGWSAGEDRRRRAFVVGAATALLGAAVFVPPFLWAGQSLDFLQADNPPWAGLASHLGRAAAKSLYLPGGVGAVLCLLAVPAVASTTVRRWSSDVVVRFAVLVLVGTGALFVTYPWKFGHLLPAWLAVVVLIARSRWATPRFLGALLATQLLHAVVSVWFLAPDTVGRAEGARLDLRAGAGVLVTDVRCRVADTPDDVEAGSQAAIERRFECMLEPFRGVTDDGVDPLVG